MKKIILITALPLLLTGCFEEKTEEVHTVDWFLENPAALDETVKKCNNNPGELANTSNCKNAVQATHEKYTGTINDIGW